MAKGFWITTYRSISNSDALAAYAKLVEGHAQFGRYEEAVRLVKHMAGLRDSAELAVYVADLKERHRRKRNFMKLL